MHYVKPQITILTTILLGAVGFSLAQNAAAMPISGLGSPSAHSDLAGGAVVNFEADNHGDAAVSFAYPDVTMTGNNVLRITNSFNGAFNVTGNSMALTANDRTQEVTFDFLSAVDAFGFNLGGVDQQWRLIAYSVTNSILEDITLPLTGSSNNGEWFGISAPGIASARLYNSAFDVGNNSGITDYVVFDNFTYVKSVPEPATLLLMCLGLAGISVAGNNRGSSASEKSAFKSLSTAVFG